MPGLGSVDGDGRGQHVALGDVAQFRIAQLRVGVLPLRLLGCKGVRSGLLVGGRGSRERARLGGADDGGRAGGVARRGRARLSVARFRGSLGLPRLQSRRGVIAAADFLTAVDDVEGARGLVVSMTVLGEVALRMVRVRVRSPCGRAAMLAGFAACGVAAAAACVVGIVVYDEFFVARGGEGGVGKLSLVGFFWRPGWL